MGSNTASVAVTGVDIRQGGFSHTKDQVVAEFDLREGGIGVGEYDGVVLNVRRKFRAAPAARQSHPNVVPLGWLENACPASTSAASLCRDAASPRIASIIASALPSASHRATSATIRNADICTVARNAAATNPADS
jgi:hypothetical protein